MNSWLRDEGIADLLLKAHVSFCMEWSQQQEQECVTSETEQALLKPAVACACAVLKEGER